MRFIWGLFIVYFCRYFLNAISIDVGSLMDVSCFNLFRVFLVMSDTTMNDDEDNKP